GEERHDLRLAVDLEARFRRQRRVADAIEPIGDELFALGDGLRDGPIAHLACSLLSALRCFRFQLRNAHLFLACARGLVRRARGFVPSARGSSPHCRVRGNFLIALPYVFYRTSCVEALRAPYGLPRLCGGSGTHCHACFHALRGRERIGRGWKESCVEGW